LAAGELLRDAVGWAVDDFAVDAGFEDFDGPGAGAEAVDDGVADGVGEPTGADVCRGGAFRVGGEFGGPRVDAVGQPSG
jgi:hypothetical protein